jgi:hypothetical protein
MTVYSKDGKKLGKNEEKEDSKRRYKFPCGDFQRVHRCGVLAAESRAGQRKYFAIEAAAAHLHGMLEALARPRVASSAFAASRCATPGAGAET